MLAPCWPNDSELHALYVMLFQPLVLPHMRICPTTAEGNLYPYDIESSMAYNAHDDHYALQHRRTVVPVIAAARLEIMTLPNPIWSARKSSREINLIEVLQYSCLVASRAVLVFSPHR